MIQGGDPTGTGKGGTSIWGKKFNDEIRDSLKHNARGILSMANSGANSNGSQFFITYAKQPHLNGGYTIFGKVIHGFEVLDLMEKRDMENEEANSSSTPTEICIQKLGYIPGHLKGRSASKRNILANESLQRELQLEKEKTKKLQIHINKIEKKHNKMEKKHNSLKQKVDYLMKHLPHLSGWQSQGQENEENDGSDDGDDGQENEENEEYDESDDGQENEENAGSDDDDVGSDDDGQEHEENVGSDDDGQEHQDFI